MQQAKKALKYCLTQLKPKDRFAIINFATTVKPVPRQARGGEQGQRRRRHQVGGRPRSHRRHRDRRRPRRRPRDARRTTPAGPSPSCSSPTASRPSARPTPTRSCKNVGGEEQRQHAASSPSAWATTSTPPCSTSSPTRPGPSAPTSAKPRTSRRRSPSLYGKISNPVLTNLKLTIGDNVSTRRGLSAAAARPVPRQPARRPRPLHRQGPRRDQADRAWSARRRQEFVYELNFPDKTESDRQGLRRGAVGAPQGRLPARPDPRQRREEGTGRGSGRAGQAVRHHDAVHELPGRAGRPDAGRPADAAAGRPGGPLPKAAPFPAPPIAGGAGGGFGPGHPDGPGRQAGPRRGLRQESGAGDKGDGKSGLAGNRGVMTERQVKEAIDQLKSEKDPALRAKLTEEVRSTPSRRRCGTTRTRVKGKKDGYQTGQLGVDLSCAANQLRNQDRMSLTANRNVYGRNCLEIGGVWIDDAYKADTKSITVKRRATRTSASSNCTRRSRTSTGSATTSSGSPRAARRS